MFVDLHLHEKLFSSDSFISVEEIVEVARKRGVGAVCVTDHDSMGLYDKCDEYSRRLDFPIFCGVEYLTLQGDITAFGIKQFPDHRIDAQDFLDMAKEQGAFTVSCHPFRTNNRGLGERVLKLKDLHGVEVLNGGTPVWENAPALSLCQRAGLKQIGGSDAHLYENICNFVTWLPCEVKTMDQLVSALFSEETHAAQWMGSHYSILSGK